MANFKPFPINKKFRITTGEISFYATKKQIQTGVGDHSNFNDAVWWVLSVYEDCKIVDPKVSGFMSTHNGFCIQLTPVK